MNEYGALAIVLVLFAIMIQLIVLNHLLGQIVEKL